MQSMTVQDVQQALDAFQLGIVITIYEQSTATSQLAAEAIGCELGQIAKSICFVVDALPVLVVTSGEQRVDDRKVAALLGVSRKAVKLARAEECVALFGYAPGGVPPLGHRTRPAHIFLDAHLQRYHTIYAAGGAANAIFPLTLDQLKAVTGGTFADVTRDSA
jgi:prolyl-tRNA editing enzyme YbaK/EbsC (Cys-tRNA(Pro) deacylase)